MQKIRIKEKEKEYSKLKLESTEQIFATINVNLQDDYKYNEKTQILIIDNVNKCNNIFTIPSEELDNVNSINPLAQGMYINELYNRGNQVPHTPPSSVRS